MRSDILNSNSGVGGVELKIKKVLASVTLTQNDSGTVILVNPTTTTEIDLPALTTVSDGWHCTIILTEDTFSTDQGMGQKVNIDFGSGNTINGQTWGSDGDAGDVSATGDDFIACSASCTGGDRFDVFAANGIWYCHGWVRDASECPFATAAG